MLTTTAPISIAPAATAFVDRAGLSADFDRLLEHTVHTVLGLCAIDVTYSPYYDEGSDELVRFNAKVAVTSEEALEAEDEWMKWVVANFPYDVTRRFVLFAHAESADAR